jgi:hypothetical protein
MANTQRITSDSADLTESTTKRVDGGITEDATKRVTQDATATPVLQERLGDEYGDTWKSCWGEPTDHEAGTGANTFFRTFVGWFSTPRINPKDTATQRVDGAITANITKRVPAPNP